MRYGPAWRAWGLALLLTSLPAWAEAQQAPVPAPTNDDCQICHGEPSSERANGTSIYVDAARFAASVHGQIDLQCVDCHADLAAAELPHPEGLQPAQCTSCHDGSAFEMSVHGRALAAGKPGAPTCAACHGAHDVMPAKDPRSRTYHLAITQTCGACHGGGAPGGTGVPGGDVLHPFEDSIHGRALLRSGLTVAPTCVTCHGAHDVVAKHESASKVHRANLATTCGSCHEGIERQYLDGRHGTLVQNGDPRAPVCADCHSAHHIQRAEREAWQLEVIGECGTCHTDKMRTYRDTFHGKVTELGFTRVATCASCHGAHQILPASDPNSPVSPERRQQTCQRCHPGTNANFAAYDPHPDPHDRARNPLLFYTASFMQILLAGVFSFFGIHSGLWFTRSLQEVRRRRRPVPAAHPQSDAPAEGNEETQA